MKGLIMLLIFVLMVTQASALTVINEFMYNPSGEDNNKEFIEIFSDDNVTFENYTIQDLSGGKDNLKLVKNVDSQYSLIVEDGFDYSSINASVYAVGNTIGNGLNNDKDVIIIFDDEGKIIDLVYYSSDWGGDNNGKSLEKIDFNLISSNSENWVESNLDGGSPGKENKLQFVNYNAIKINEFLPDPLGQDDASMPNGEFIEILNNGEEDFELNGFYLEDKLGHRLNIDNTHAFSNKINSKDYLVIYANGFSGFLNNDEDEIKLFYNNILLDKVVYSSTKEDFSYSNVNNAWILTHPTPNEANEFGKIINKSYLKILKNEGNFNFGDIIEVKLEVYKGNTRKNSVNLVVENENNKISEEVNFNIYGKYVNYTINVPIQLYPNCNLKYLDGDYKIKVSGLEEDDEKEIEVFGLNDKLCNIQGEKKIKSDDLYFELLEFPKETRISDEVITKVKLVNNSTAQENLEMWSYIYKGSESVTGDFQGNLKKVSINPNNEIIIELKNNLDYHVDPGEYKLRVRIKKEERKTPDDFTTNIMVIENEKNLTNILTSNTVYESSDIKAKNSVFMITLIVLVLMIIFLIFRKGL